MRIIWDEPKRLANIEKHGLDFDFVDMTTEFLERATIIPAKRGRWKAVGRWRTGMAAVIFSRLGDEAISLISFRPAGANERKKLDG